LWASQNLGHIRSQMPLDDVLLHRSKSMKQRELFWGNVSGKLLVKASIRDTNDCYLKSFANDKRFVVSDHLHQSATALKKILEANIWRSMLVKEPRIQIELSWFILLIVCVNSIFHKPFFNHPQCTQVLNLQKWKHQRNSFGVNGVFPNHCFMFVTGKIVPLQLRSMSPQQPFVTCSCSVVNTNLKPGLKKIAWNRLKLWICLKDKIMDCLKVSVKIEIK